MPSKSHLLMTAVLAVGAFLVGSMVGLENAPSKMQLNPQCDQGEIISLEGRLDRCDEQLTSRNEQLTSCNEVVYMIDMLCRNEVLDCLDEQSFDPA